jgi:uncharacterized iron-regulated membrane protein
MGTLKNTWLRRLFRLHSWLGLLTGLPLLLLGLSGAALVFKPELDRLLAPRAAPPPAGHAPVPLDSLYRQVGRRYPALKRMAIVGFPRQAGDSYEFRLYGNDGNPNTYDLASVFVDPYSGRILREGANTGLAGGLLNWLLQFHFCFQLGMWGILLTALLGLAMLASLLTGAVVYRKHLKAVLTLQAPFRWHNWRVLASDAHRYIGTWSLLLNALICFTGFWMNLFGFDLAAWRAQRQPALPNHLMLRSVDEMLATAQAAYPALIPTRIRLPTQPGQAPFEVDGIVPGHELPWGPGAAVEIDPTTGRVRAVRRAWTAAWPTQWEALVGPLHFGTVGGLPLRVLYVGVGLTPGWLALTGFALWYRRRPRPAKLSRQRN